MQSIDHLIEECCRQFSGQTAFRHKSAGRWQETSYEELWDLVRRLAAGLAEGQLLKPGQHAAIIASPGPRWVASYLAILRCGGVAVPIDKELKANELRHILVDSEACLLFSDSSLVETLTDILGQLPNLQKIIFLDDSPVPVEQTEPIEELVSAWRSLVRDKKVPEEEATRLEQLAQKAFQKFSNKADNRKGEKTLEFLAPGRMVLRHWLEEGKIDRLAQVLRDGPLPANNEGPNRVAVILYTSGTTGQSKGAMLSHENIVTNIHSSARHFGLTGNISTLSFLPINHVFEQVCGILLPLSLGGTINFAESIKKLGENLAEIKPTFLLGVPAVYRLLLDRIHKNIQSGKMSRLLFANSITRRVVAAKVRQSVGPETKFISGGAALDPAVAKGFLDLGLQLYQGYGITETSPVISAESPSYRKVGTVGLPIENVRIRIDNPNEDGVGEIWVKGPNVMQGYFKNPRATAEVLTDGWYHTGDLGRLDQDGYLTICGRVKNLIVTPNGKNVYPEEVENELLNSPYISEVMVYGHKIGTAGEEVYAVIYPDQGALDALQQDKGAPLTQADLELLIRNEVLQAGKNLADYKRVRRFTLREDEFPKTTTRKIKRYVVEPEISTSD